MLTRSKYKMLCMKALQNNISKSEQEILDKWIEKSSLNKAEFDQIKKLWIDMGTLPVNPPAVNVKNEWELLEQKLNTVQNIEHAKLSILDKMKDIFRTLSAFPRYIYLKPVYSVAALTILIASSILIYQNIRELDVHFQTFTTANKQKVNLQLSDGSSIKLNSGSSITVQNDFADDKRVVKLKGEAYFDVAKEKRPCIIKTDNAKIEVLGTSFNVWSRDNQTRVIVKEGVVRLSSLKSDKDFVLIEADQMSQVRAGANPIDTKQVQADRLIGWIEGKLFFEHCPLNEFIDEIERQYNIEVQMHSDDMKDLKLTGTFDNLTIDQILSSVCLTFDLECDQIDQNIYVLMQKY